MHGFRVTLRAGQSDVDDVSTLTLWGSCTQVSLISQKLATQLCLDTVLLKTEVKCSARTAESTAPTKVIRQLTVVLRDENGEFNETTIQNVHVTANKPHMTEILLGHDWFRPKRAAEVKKMSLYYSYMKRTNGGPMFYVGNGPSRRCVRYEPIPDDSVARIGIVRAHSNGGLPVVDIMDEAVRRQRADRAERDPVQNVVTEDEAAFWICLLFLLLFLLFGVFVLSFHATPTNLADTLPTAEAKCNDSDDGATKMQVWGWIDWLFVWTIFVIVYGGTSTIIIWCLLHNSGLWCLLHNSGFAPEYDVDQNAYHNSITLMIYQGVFVSACAQRVFMQAVVYETSTALAKRLVVLHVFTFVTIVELVAYRVVLFVAVWRRIDEWVQWSNGRLQSWHYVQIRHGPLSEVLIEGTCRSLFHPILLLVIHLVGSHAHPWSAKVVSSFVCMVYEYPKIHVDILIDRLQIKSQARPPWTEIQYSVIAALLIAICCPDEVIMVSLAHQGHRAICRLWGVCDADGRIVCIEMKAAHFSAFPLTFLIFAFVVITEHLITNDAIKMVHPCDSWLRTIVITVLGYGSPIATLNGVWWWMGSWLCFVFVWLVCCVALSLSTFVCCLFSLQWFHDRLVTIRPSASQTWSSPPSACGPLCIVLTHSGLRLCEFKSWYSWAITIDVVVSITLLLSYLFDCDFVTVHQYMSPRMRFLWLSVERALQTVCDAMDSTFYLRFAIKILIFSPSTLLARTWRPELAHCEVILSLLLWVQEYPTFHCCCVMRQLSHGELSRPDAFDRLCVFLTWLNVAVAFPRLFALCQGLRLMCALWDIVRWGPPASEAMTTAREERDAARAEAEALRCRVAEMVTESTRLREDAELGNATCRQLIAKQSEAVTIAREEKDAARAETETLRCCVVDMVTESARLREDAEINVAANMQLITKQSQALKTAREEKEAFRHRITEMAKDDAKLRQALNAASDQRDTERQEYAAVTHTIAKLTADIRRVSDAADAALVQRDAARAETETSLRAIAEKTAEIAGLREAAASAQKQIADMTAERQKDQAPQISNAPESDAVVDMLRCIGIERHAALFAEHEIDCETLFLLETDDLKEIGLPFGAVVKLRKWMARSAKDAGPTAEAANDSECVVCMERKPVQCALVPCGHLSVCLECSGGLAACPICRHGVERILAVFPP